MLEEYLNQLVSYMAAQRNADNSVKLNERGEILYHAPTPFLCRSQNEVKEILTAEKQLIKISTTYYLLDKILVDDLLDNMRVQDVQAWVDLMGDVLGYKAVT